MSGSTSYNLLVQSVIVLFVLYTGTIAFVDPHVLNIHYTKEVY